MAMQIHGNYDHSGADYTERVKEKQDAERAEKAKEAEKAEKAAEEKNSGRLSEPRDEYISSEKSGQKPTGLYRVGQDENGNRKIFPAVRLDFSANSPCLALVSFDKGIIMPFGRMIYSQENTCIIHIITL